MRFRALTIVSATLVMACFGSAAHAGEQAPGNTVVRMDVIGVPNGGNPSGGGGRFTLTAGRSADRGTESYAFFGSGGQVTLRSKKGSLVLGLKARPSGLHVDSEGLDLWTGTWSISSGTGAYLGLKGVGAYVGIVGPSYRVALHLEGFVKE